MDDDLDRLLEELEEEEDLELKVECGRCGSRHWDQAKFKGGRVIRCSDCPREMH